MYRWFYFFFSEASTAYWILRPCETREPLRQRQLAAGYPAWRNPIKSRPTRLLLRPVYLHPTQLLGKIPSARNSVLPRTQTWSARTGENQEVFLLSSFSSFRLCTMKASLKTSRLRFDFFLCRCCNCAWFLRIADLWNDNDSV